MIPLEQIRKFISIFFIAFFAILCSVSILNIFQCRRENGRTSEIITKVDTLYLRDTFRIEKPAPIIIRNTDTILVQIKDTIRIKDTIYIKLQKEQKIYQDENYRAWISGYRPALDSIHIFRNTQQIITSTTIQSKQKDSKWGIGIQVGYGISVQQNRFTPTPYIGIGISKNLLPF